MHPPKEYKKPEPARDHFLHWTAKVIIFLLALLCIGFLGFWLKLNQIYGGNPASGGRQLVCALAHDDAQKDPEVAVVFEENCKEFTEKFDP